MHLGSIQRNTTERTVRRETRGSNVLSVLFGYECVAGVGMMRRMVRRLLYVLHYVRDISRRLGILLPDQRQGQGALTRPRS